MRAANPTARRRRRFFKGRVLFGGCSPEKEQPAAGVVFLWVLLLDIPVRQYGHHVLPQSVFATAHQHTMYHVPAARQVVCLAIFHCHKAIDCFSCRRFVCSVLTPCGMLLLWKHCRTIYQKRQQVLACLLRALELLLPRCCPLRACISRSATRAPLFRLAAPSPHQHQHIPRPMALSQV